MRCILFDPKRELSELNLFLKDCGYGIYDTYNHEDFGDALENLPANIVVATDAVADNDDGFDAEHALKTHKVFVAMQNIDDDREYFLISDHKKLIDLDFVKQYSRDSINELKAKILEMSKTRSSLNADNVFVFKKKD